MNVLAAISLPSFTLESAPEEVVVVMREEYRSLTATQLYAYQNGRPEILHCRPEFDEHSEECIKAKRIR